MHLYIIRHGECLGQIDPDAFSDPDTALSAKGEAQARLTAKRFSEEGLTQLVSSPLVRALTTASLIREGLGECPLDVWPEVVEVNGRSYQGLKGEALRERFPMVNWQDVPAEGWQYGGELYGGIFDRCTVVLNRLKARFGNEDRVGLVTHGAFANYLLNTILNIAPTTPQWFELANCSISKVRFVANPEEERPNWPLFPPVPAEILSVNDTDI